MLHFVIGSSAGVKINGRPVRARDYLPDHAIPSNEEMMMAEVARESAKQNQNG